MTTLACYLCIIYANKELTEEITGIIAPMVTVFLLSYFVACKFNELFDMTIETILLCYIADEEMFPPEERYAEGSLQEAVSSTSEAAKASGVHKDEEAPSPEKEIEVVDAQ
jgi:hypothetical protein